MRTIVPIEDHDCERDAVLESMVLRQACREYNQSHGNLIPLLVALNWATPAFLLSVALLLIVVVK